MEYDEEFKREFPNVVRHDETHDERVHLLNFFERAKKSNMHLCKRFDRGEDFFEKRLSWSPCGRLQIEKEINRQFDIDGVELEKERRKLLERQKELNE